MKRLPLLLLLLLAAACTREERPATCRALLQLYPSQPFTRAADPDEGLISDYNLLIFNSFGVLEEKVYVPARQLQLSQGRVLHATTLLRDVPYTLLAAANLGYELPCCTLEEALAYRYPLAYPDEYSHGMPMAACLEKHCLGGDAAVDIPLERLMARVDLRIDRRALDSDVRFEVREVRLGGCPSSARLFGTSKAETARDVFLNGFSKTGAQVAALNRDQELGLSEAVPLYLLENCQGDLLEHVSTDSGKVFTDGRYQDVCAYVEIKAEYHSDSWHSRPGGHLRYRFYLGENLNNFDVRRNVRYQLTVRPEGDGLREESWRVDKTEMEPQTRMELHPAAYNECRSGDDFHLWCEVLPKGTPMQIECLAHDDDEQVAALYSYTLDEDGNGLTLHTWKGGTAVISFSAGPPVNRDTLALVVIDP